MTRNHAEGAAPKLEVEGGIERAPCALDSPEFRNVHLTVRGVEFQGLQGLSPAELGSASTPFIGRDQPISVVCEIRDRAATILRNAGYMTRDSRMKERKKYGQRGARRRFQFSKR